MRGKTKAKKTKPTRMIDVGQIEPPQALTKKEFDLRNFPGATMRDIDPGFCRWFEETSPFYPLRMILRWLLGLVGIRRRQYDRRLDTAKDWKHGNEED